jgi:hypothetical protein
MPVIPCGSDGVTGNSYVEKQAGTAWKEPRNDDQQNGLNHLAE